MSFPTDTGGYVSEECPSCEVIVVESNSYHQWRASGGRGGLTGVGCPLPQAIVLPLTPELTGLVAAEALLGRAPRRIQGAEAERALRNAWSTELDSHASLDAVLPELLAEVADSWDVKIRGRDWQVIRPEASLLSANVNEDVVLEVQEWDVNDRAKFALFGLRDRLGLLLRPYGYSAPGPEAFRQLIAGDVNGLFGAHGISDGWGREPHRHILALLYTAEDAHVASYVRSHFLELDALSGNLCDIVVFENPNVLEGAAWWAPILDKTVLALWRAVGWTASRPFDMRQCYVVAEDVGIPPSDIPCVVVLDRLAESGRSLPRRLSGSLGVPQRELKPTTILHRALSGDLTRVFRDLVSEVSQLGDPRHERSNISSSDPTRSDCFLSFSSKHRTLARHVVARLHARGVNCWFDEKGINAGDGWVQEIERGLEGCGGLAVLISKVTFESPWVRREIDAALIRTSRDTSFFILPVMIDDSDPPLLLQTIQHERVRLDATQIAQAIEAAVVRRKNRNERMR